MKFLIYILSLVMLVNFVCLKGEEDATKNSGLETRDIVCLATIVLAPTIAILCTFWSQHDQIKKINSNMDELKASLAAFIALNETPSSSGDSSPKEEDKTESPKVLPRSVSFVRLDGIEAKIDNLSKNLIEIVRDAIVKAKVIPEYPGNAGLPAPLNGQPLNPPIAIKTVKDQKDNNNGRK